MRLYNILVSCCLGIASSSVSGQPVFSSAERADSVTPYSWSLLIEAALGSVHDPLATFGVRNDATGGYDQQYDTPRPPNPPGNFIEVYFPHSEEDWPVSLGSKFASDFQDPGDPAWLLKVETGLSGVTTLAWDTSDINKLPESYSFWMRDSEASVNINLRSVNSYVFSYNGPRTFALWIDYGVSFFDVTSKWNLISLPRIAPVPLKSVLFPAAATDAFAYESGYIAAETLENGKGYWLKFDEAGQIPVTGIELQDITIPLVAGWNLIGSVGKKVPVPDGSMIVSDFFGYEGGYIKTDTLMPGKGYWVKAAGAGEIVIGTGQSASSGMKANDQIRSRILLK